jgi:hypothetical protein
MAAVPVILFPLRLSFVDCFFSQMSPPSSTGDCYIILRLSMSTTSALHLSPFRAVLRLLNTRDVHGPACTNMF